MLQVDWNKTKDELPPEGWIVETKIDDPIDGCRNVCYLRRLGDKWFIPFDDVYVLYVPTHWRN